MTTPLQPMHRWVTLRTGDARFVCRAQIPDFAAAPEVLVWGARVFEHHSLEADGTLQYREVMAFIVGVVEPVSEPEAIETTVEERQPRWPVRFLFQCVHPGCEGRLELSGFYQDQLVVGVPWTCPACDRFQLARLTDEQCPPSPHVQIEFAAAETPGGVTCQPTSSEEGRRRARRLLRSRAT